jgi:cytochrome c5
MHRSYVLIVGLACGMSAACRQQPPAATNTAANSTAATASQSRADALILAAVRVGLPPANVVAADLPDPNSRGAQLLNTYCAQCHALPTPLAHSATDWPGVVRRMWLRMDFIADTFGVRKPTTPERYYLLEYLTTNALRVSGATLPAGPGRETFESVCSQCHALPDPRMHSPQDWDIVLVRMMANMQRMSVAQPSEDQKNSVLLYLHSLKGGPAGR